MLCVWFNSVPMSIALLVGSLYGALFAVILWYTTRNCQENRFLAALLIVVALQLLLYIIGDAGVYDKFPWLSYLPCSSKGRLGGIFSGGR